MHMLNYTMLQVTVSLGVHSGVAEQLKTLDVHLLSKEAKLTWNIDSVPCTSVDPLSSDFCHALAGVSLQKCREQARKMARYMPLDLASLADCYCKFVYAVVTFPFVTVRYLQLSATVPIVNMYSSNIGVNFN